MSWCNYSMDLLVTIVCLVLGNGHLVQAATLLRYDEVTQAEGLPLSMACQGGVYSGMSLDQLRDSGRQSGGLTAFSFSPFGRRRLLQDSPHRSVSVGTGVALAISIPLTVMVVLACVIFGLYVRSRRNSPPKSPLPSYAQDETSTSWSSQIKCPLNGRAKRVRSWMDSFRDSFSALMSSAKFKDELVPTSGSKLGLRPWMKPSFCLQIIVPPKPKIYLSSACEMEFSKLQAATDNFSDANLLGEGGSAKVYRAKLDGGDYGAVKMITAHGRNAFAGFQGEVDLMRQVRHPNLVSLLGYCYQGERRLLVYELMRNGSLEDQLYGPKRGTGLPWFRRIKIALDSARGLEYLHEQCVPSVVHRDFKASNVLLDENLNAKISDFGLATPLEGLTQEESLQLVGTIGYVAPEFFLSGTLTEKSDVYAFGVTLLELITGRKPIDHSLPPDQQSLVNWAAPQLTNRDKLPKLVASHLQVDLNLKHLYQVAAVAALCVQKESSYRPLIADVVQSLLPLVPVELGGALRKDSHCNSSSTGSSRFSSQHEHGHEDHQESLKYGSESFSFGDEIAGNDFDLPPDISSQASSGEIRATAL